MRIDHAMFLERELIARLADLGVWVVGQPSFLSDSGGAAPSPELMLRPFRSVHAAGIPQAFSSDFPCGALAPLAGIAAAVTRRSRAGALAAPGAWLKLFVDGGYRCAMRIGHGAAARRGGFLFYGRDELAARLLAAWRQGRRVI